ncbi:glycosyltransferase family 4 protein [Pseudomonadota bacterium]
MTELTAALSSDVDVRVVTTRKLSSDPKVRLPHKEHKGRVQIYRIWTTRLGRPNLLWRAIDYLSFHLSVQFFLLRHVRRGDIVVLKTDPPLLQLFTTGVIRLKRGKVINWIQDIYPEIAERLGKFPGPGWLSGFVKAWRDRALNRAARNIVISEPMAAYLRQRAVAGVEVIPNWADGSAITPVEHGENPLRSEWGLAGKFVVMYSGNFGRVHALEEIIEAATKLADEPEIQFVFVGEGAGLAGLKDALAAASVGNAVFEPFQPRARLRFSLGAADLHLVSLKNGMEELVMPSKLYGIMAAGRPVAFVGQPDSAIGAFIQKENIGFSVSSGEGAVLAESIRELAKNPGRALHGGENARVLFETEYSLGAGAVRWRTLLASVQSS